MSSDDGFEKLPLVAPQKDSDGYQRQNAKFRKADYLFFSIAVIVLVITGQFT
jgi:hypothetical protein